MNLKELYTGAIKEGFEWLALLIEFLVLEKKVITWESNSEELHLYYLPKHRERMNKLITQYKEEIK